MRQFILLPLLLILLRFCEGLNYKCHNDQVLVVQSFGNDTIRMHCQRLDLCGYQSLKCDYDELQPQCGGRLNFVSHVNQKNPTSPVEHTCCNLFNPRAPHAVPTHTGNDCFIYELPDGTTNGKKADPSPSDDAPYAVLKNPAEIPEQFDGITGYRLRLFLLKNKSPPTLLVKGIERRLDGYRVTICRPRCTSYDKINENNNGGQDSGENGEWRAISWSSWSSSSWSTWARHAFNKAAGGTEERVRTREGEGKSPGNVNININNNGEISGKDSGADSGAGTESGAGSGAGAGAGAGTKSDGNININIHTGNGTGGSSVAVANASVNLNGGNGSKNGNGSSGNNSGSGNTSENGKGGSNSGLSGSGEASESSGKGSGKSDGNGGNSTGSSGNGKDSGDSGNSTSSGAGTGSGSGNGNGNGNGNGKGDGKSDNNNSSSKGSNGKSSGNNPGSSGKTSSGNAWKDESDEADDDGDDNDILGENGGKIIVNIETAGKNSTSVGGGAGGSGTNNGKSGASGKDNRKGNNKNGAGNGNGNGITDPDGENESINTSEKVGTKGGLTASVASKAKSGEESTTSGSTGGGGDDDDDVDVTDEVVGTKTISEKKVEELLAKLPNLTSKEIEQAKTRGDRLAGGATAKVNRKANRESSETSSSSGTSDSSSGTSSSDTGSSSSGSTASDTGSSSSGSTASDSTGSTGTETAAQSDAVASDTASGTGTSSGGMNCFSGDTLVTTVTGQKRMDELMIGDFVLVPSAGNVLKYERVEMFYHREAETRASFVVLYTESGRRLSLTGRHLLPAAECGIINHYISSADGIDIAMRESKYAEKARRGECVLSVDPYSGNVIADKIVRIGRKSSKGIYSPMTVEGSLVADGILSSCFSHLESHTVHKVVFDFLFMVYDFFGMVNNDVSVELQPIPTFVSFVQDLSKHIIPFS